MRVLITGGTGVVGRAAVRALLARGHDVRVLSRHANDDADQWPSGVEPFVGDVGDPATLEGCATDCDAVVHAVGIVRESPPEATFDRVNVRGTEAMLEEAERAGVPFFVYISSLGAERGESDYHRSKALGEARVRDFPRKWLILRPGNVYGPGDEQVSLLLRMVRTLPVVPVLEGGDVPFQPVWCDDVGEAIARAVERDDLHGRALDIAGPERTTQNELLDRFDRLTGRAPMRVPLPGFLASLGVRVASAFGVQAPLTEDQLTMLTEGNLVEDPADNALDSVLEVTPTPLDDGLRMLVDVQDEQLPRDGTGRTERKHFRADIVGSGLDAESLFALVRDRFREVMAVPLDVEPGSAAPVEEGATITLNLALRGNVQVRVEEVGPRQLTLVTLAGHPIAGAVRFLAEERGEAVRFEVQVYERPASLADMIALRLGGALLQNGAWRRAVENVVSMSGGTAPRGVEEETETLDEEQADLVDRWLEALVQARRRDDERVATRADVAPADRAGGSPRAAQRRPDEAARPDPA
jgi:NADH dehydrogenase